ncbi:MAG: hypothetical protein U5Q03_08885 [Bacteroidota bacterium]|nr:hypothetical protein [Bacteroidota bacterium]
MSRKKYFLLIIIFCALIPVTNAQLEFEIPAESFKDYWYAGKAEIAHYELEQARYGEIHPGRAVLIFVTEDFSKSKQVKLDHPHRDREDAVKVMKLNLTKKFLTGIYPYSVMASVFTPVGTKAFNNALKITASTQEWCGHVYTQMNHRGDDFLLKSFSYFEAEGDKMFQLQDYFAEDNIWNLIRLDPNKLPLGKVIMIPSAIESRMKHFELLPETVYASLKTKSEDAGLAVYRIEYKKSGRILSITFEKKFPFRILGWEEKSKGIVHGGNKVLTSARLKEYIHTDYWNKNSLKDTLWREKLGLPQY